MFVEHWGSNRIVLEIVACYESFGRLDDFQKAHSQVAQGRVGGLDPRVKIQNGL